MTTLKINSKFKNLIPPLSQEEYSGLEESILQQGCRDSIKHWRGAIVDGHNRYAICQRHSIEYKTTKMRFSSHKDAALWIVENQLGRRNLTTASRIKLAMHKSALLQEKAQKNRTTPGCEPINMRKVYAADANTSEGTVQKYMKIIKQGSPKLIDQVHNGELKIGAAHRILQVTTIEEMCSKEAIASFDINLAPLISAMQSHIAWIKTLYRFILATPWFFGDGADNLLVCKRIDVQVGVLKEFEETF